MESSSKLFDLAPSLFKSKCDSLSISFDVAVFDGEIEFVRFEPKAVVVDLQ
jgi:hypothetical protein